MSIPFCLCPSHLPQPPSRGRGGQQPPLRLVGQEGETFDYRTQEGKAYLRLLLEPDGDSGGTQFDIGDEGTPVHKISGRKQKRSHTSRKRNLSDTSLTASPASPPQPGTASRVAKKSKKADSAPPSFRIVSSASVTEKTASDLITVQSNSDSDTTSTTSQGKQTVVPSVSVSQPTTARVENQTALVTTPYTRMAPAEWLKNRLQWYSILIELLKHSKESQGPIKVITDSDQFSALVRFFAPPQVVAAWDDSEEMVQGTQKLAANGNDEKWGVRAVSALIHQTGMTLSQRGQNLLPETLKVEYANSPPPTTTAIFPAISYF
jgi:hypothetical protein